MSHTVTEVSDAHCIVQKEFGSTAFAEYSWRGIWRICYRASGKLRRFSGETFEEALANARNNVVEE